MRLAKRIDAFGRLGQAIHELRATELLEISDRAAHENPWFTPANVKTALAGVTTLLHETTLQQWTSSYSLEPTHPRTIGVAMAGNIPLVGFHDFLCVLISGHRLKAKLSSKDSILLSYLSHRLIAREPEFKDLISFEERLNDVDAVIATGGNNTARYFEYYFRNIPHIIRKNRSSSAVISPKDSLSDLSNLGLDVFSYFGLGCRNVSKLYVPEGYDFIPLLAGWEKYGTIIDHSKYANNYDYQKSILQMNKIPFLDNGFILLAENTSFVSPIAVLYYESYADTQELTQHMNHQREKIQCVVSGHAWFSGSLEFGQAQFPKVSDYADSVDTLKFLDSL